MAFEKDILEDLRLNKNEGERIKRDHKGWSIDDVWWRVRYWEMKIGYFLNSMAIFAAIIILYFTKSFMTAIIFLIWIQLWRLDANIRGLTLHGENFIEWFIKKEI